MDQQSLPKYQAVHDELLNRLEAGYYSVGTRLPTEQMLAESFGVSRVTVRKALEMLVQSGYVSARQGSGYVVDTLSPPSSTCLVSFTDQVIREGRMPGARLLGVRAPARDVPDSVTALFEEDLALIERLRTVDGKPVMLVRTWVPMRHVAGISAEDFPEEGQDQSILRILANRFRITWSRACEVISSQTADEQVARLLDIPVNTPILTQACTAFDDRHAPVFFDEVYRGAPLTYNLEKAPCAGRAGKCHEGDHRADQGVAAELFPGKVRGVRDRHAGPGGRCGRA